jgi:hypothetical protein
MRGGVKGVISFPPSPYFSPFQLNDRKLEWDGWELSSAAGAGSSRRRLFLHVRSRPALISGQRLRKSSSALRPRLRLRWGQLTLFLRVQRPFSPWRLCQSVSRYVRNETGAKNTTSIFLSFFYEISRGHIGWSLGSCTNPESWT